MRWDFWSLCVPLVSGHLCAPAETAGRTDFFLGVKRDLPASPAGDMSELVHLSH